MQSREPLITESNSFKNGADLNKPPWETQQMAQIQIRRQGNKNTKTKSKPKTPREHRWEHMEENRRTEKTGETGLMWGNRWTDKEEGKNTGSNTQGLINKLNTCVHRKKGREETKAGHGKSQQKERYMRTNSTNSLNLTPMPLFDLHKQRRA